MSFSKRVIVITGTRSSLATLRPLVSKMPSSFGWIYCGKDVPFSLELEALLGRELKIGLGPYLQETAREFRQQYIDFIGRMSLSASGEDPFGCWWLSSISEKNPLISDVLLHFCYLKACAGILEERSGDMIVICESRALSESLVEILRSAHGCLVISADPQEGVLGKRVAYLLPAARKCWFVGTGLFRIVTARIFRLCRRIQSGHPTDPADLCIHAFTDIRSLAASDHYTHIFFRRLGPDLDRSNIRYSYLIDVLPTVSYVQAVRTLCRYPESCFLLEEFIRPSDIFKVISLICRGGRLGTRGLFLCGIPMDRILEEEANRDGMNTRREESILRYYAGKRLSSRKHLRVFIYTFENHIWEKMFCLAFRRFSKDTVLVGYAHSIVNAMYTCYSVSGFEQDLLPGPDIIAVNGTWAKSALQQSGFTRQRIEISGALRYHNLEKIEFRYGHRDNLRVLVALSAGINDSLELAHKILSALKNETGVSIILKCHPTLPFTFISPYIGPLPENACIRDEPVENLLRESDVLMYAESTVCVEALAMGVPIVNVRSDYHIDMNIFEGIDAVPSVSSADEIRHILPIVTSDTARDRFNALQSIIGEIFARVDPDYLEIFTQDIVSKGGC